MSHSLEANLGVSIACLPALRLLFSGLTQLATRLLSRLPSSYDQRKAKRSPFQSQQKSLNRIDSSRENDADGLTLIPLNKIAIETTTHVAFGQQASMSSEAVRPWEHE